MALSKQRYMVIIMIMSDVYSEVFSHTVYLSELEHR